MEKEPRKATDVLLQMESKLNIALEIIRNQDLNIKILSNKINSVLAILEKQSTSKIVVETVNTIPTSPMLIPKAGPLSEREVAISAESHLPVENSPQGFRRTSRPETFTGDDVYLGQQATKYPTQLPKTPMTGANTPPPGRSVGEAIIPDKASKKLDVSTVPSNPQPIKQNVINNAIPVSQRVVNSHGKSLFLADVEILDLTSMQTVVKTRTNGTGKWSASLGMGSYRVFIRKLDSGTKERLEVKQDITIDGSQSPLELQAVIVKP